MLTQMILYLSTKEAVRTCVLSNRWKSVWLLTPKLDLDSFEFPDYNSFVSFVENFIGFSREEKSCLQKFKLSIRKDENDKSCVTRWIDFVATPKLKYLEVEFGPLKPECWEVMPLSLYVCDTLVYLRLHRVLLGKFESVSLHCLKIMCLEHNHYENEEGLELPISPCPVLEDLGIVRRVYNNVKVLRVRSKTLTSLSIQLESHDFEVEDRIKESEYEPLRLLVDAPRLEYLNLEDDITKIFYQLWFLNQVLCGAIFTPTLQLVQFGSRDVFWRPDNSAKLSSSLSESKIPNLGFTILQCESNETLIRASVFANIARGGRDKKRILRRAYRNGTSKLHYRELGNPQEASSSFEMFRYAKRKFCHRSESSSIAEVI
ncbi:Leucine-rich repeat 2 [Arabidopsis thaliana x Arabidopsis arenosa]|uniref:Leucine-rich repeat 2 n=1 Tax=Arabidopsis thaliana x Arabidopsis arenosa TaxID=1240361 RepID=A0A8T2BK31_9BRAS|nr:Leucine-rich repeat 2 [Arabidopsis thaliana x Arabidopsis arenosa]